MGISAIRRSSGLSAAEAGPRSSVASTGATAVGRPARWRSWSKVDRSRIRTSPGTPPARARENFPVAPFAGIRGPGPGSNRANRAGVPVRPGVGAASFPTTARRLQVSPLWGGPASTPSQSRRAIGPCLQAVAGREATPRRRPPVSGQVASVRAGPGGGVDSAAATAVTASASNLAVRGVAGPDPSAISAVAVAVCTARVAPAVWLRSPCGSCWSWWRWWSWAASTRPSS